MSFNKFKADFLNEFPAMATNTKMMAFINNYERIKVTTSSNFIHNTSDEDNVAETPPTEGGAVRMPFGKYKNFLISDLCKMDAGRQYLTWLYSQSFFDAEKFPVLHKCLSDLGVTKKKAMNHAMRVGRVPAGCV